MNLTVLHYASIQNSEKAYSVSAKTCFSVIAMVKIQVVVSMLFMKHHFPCPSLEYRDHSIQVFHPTLQGGAWVHQMFLPMPATTSRMLHSINRNIILPSLPVMLIST